MKNENTIELLNSLITINNDRIEAFVMASKETEGQDLKNLFARFISTSQECKRELIRELGLMGSEPVQGTLMSGKFFRVWMDVKAALRGKDCKSILNACEYGEEKTGETYDMIIKDQSDPLSPEHQFVIIAQKSMLKADHNLLKALRDALVNVYA